MRILFATWNTRRVGGCESYIESALSGLRKSNHDVACLFEQDGTSSVPRICLPDSTPFWTMFPNASDALLSAADWRPDIVYAHALWNPSHEKDIQGLAPAVLFAHGFFGTCISGTKMWTRPQLRACHRSFGFGCLLHYFPHGCGGNNPVSMIRQFLVQRQRQNVLRGYRNVFVASQYMAAEFQRANIDPGRVRTLPLPAIAKTSLSGLELHELLDARVRAFGSCKRPARLLVVGRLEANKGCDLAIKAAAIVAQKLGRAVELTIAGDGSQRISLESMAAESPIKVCFPGWLAGNELQQVMAKADLLIVPSVWPEPFGLVGLEAAAHAVPAVAFNLGGITDWLVDGVNGAIAPSNPPTASGLADAAIQCLSSHQTLLALSRAALTAFEVWPKLDDHVNRLISLLEDACASGNPMSS